MAVQKKADVVVVGAGWTAGILAWKLTTAGYNVVSIEQGPDRWANPDFAHNHDSLRHMLRTAMMVDLANETWTWRPNPRLPSLPMRHYGSFHPGQGLGGAGIHWAAQTWRFFPTDFNYRTHHIERYGEEKLPAGNRIQDWPLSYAELEPHYMQMEDDIGISGRAGNLNGELVAGGNPFEGPRSRPYPLPPLVSSLAADRFSEAATALGLHPFPQPAAILSQGYQGLAPKPRSGCLYCGFCTRYGCEVDAKASAVNVHLPLALHTGHYTIRANSKVLGVNVGSHGLATGVTYIDRRTGEEHQQPAEVVILAGYTLTNVRLLLLSRSERHPNGIGNVRGLVGKNYTYQLNLSPVTGLFEGEQFNQYMGNSCLQAVLHDYNGDNFDHSDLDFIGGVAISCGGGERQPLPSALSLPATANTVPPDSEEEEGGRNYPGLAGQFGSLVGTGTEWGQAWKENLRRNWDSYVSIGIQGESLPYDDQFLDLDPTYTDAYGLPLLRVTYDFHENDRNLYRFLAERCREIMTTMAPANIIDTPELEPYNIYTYQSTHCTGGAIMGDDPGNSVTNKYGQVWDTPNVFVTGAALYPQNPGFNPTGTLLALAYWTGDALVEQYFRDAGRLLT